MRFTNIVSCAVALFAFAAVSLSAQQPADAKAACPAKTACAAPACPAKVAAKDNYVGTAKAQQGRGWHHKAAANCPCPQKTACEKSAAAQCPTDKTQCPKQGNTCPAKAAPAK